jgi:hypothetical protein
MFGLSLWLAPIASADACGVYIPRDGDASMARERGLVIWDGQTEQVLVELSINSDANEAAWIFPSPTRAEVRLGDAAIFAELEELTKPQIVYERRPAMPDFGAGAPMAGAPPVTVLSQQTLGPFEVTTLAATDAGALQGWLTENGYQFPQALDDVLQPYIDKGWFYVAIKLTPSAQDQTLTGQLDPLWITFESDEIVYTMRPAALAPNSFPLSLYIFAEHRVQKTMAFGPSEVAFADFVAPASLPSDSRVAPLLPRRLFLTKFRENVIPANVNDDFVFTFAAADDTYRETTVEYVEDTSWMGWVVGGSLLAACCGGAALLGALFLLLRRPARRTA